MANGSSVLQWIWMLFYLSLVTINVLTDFAARNTTGRNFHMTRLEQHFFYNKQKIFFWLSGLLFVKKARNKETKM